MPEPSLYDQVNTTSSHWPGPGWGGNRGTQEQNPWSRGGQKQNQYKMDLARAQWEQNNPEKYKTAHIEKQIKEEIEKRIREGEEQRAKDEEERRQREARERAEEIKEKIRKQKIEDEKQRKKDWEWWLKHKDKMPKQPPKPPWLNEGPPDRRMPDNIQQMITGAGGNIPSAGTSGAPGGGSQNPLSQMMEMMGGGGGGPPGGGGNPMEQMMMALKGVGGGGLGGSQKIPQGVPQGPPMQAMGPPPQQQQQRDGAPPFLKQMMAGRGQAPQLNPGMMG